MLYWKCENMFFALPLVLAVIGLSVSGVRTNFTKESCMDYVLLDQCIQVLAHLIDNFEYFLNTSSNQNQSRILAREVESRQIMLFNDMTSQGKNVTITYGDECVELLQETLLTVSAVNTFGHCVVLYAKPRCSGSYTHVYPTASDHSRVTYLYNFDDLAASFGRCDQNRDLVEQEPPLYPLEMFVGKRQSGESGIASFRSGCLSTADWWNDRLSSVRMFDDTGSYCVALYSYSNCTGTIRYLLPGSPGRDNLADIHFDKMMRSWGSCDLYYKTSCKQCPKSIFKGSSEYEFWMSLFSVYSPYKYRKEFDERVKKEPNGTISWDFLFSPGTAASRAGDQYHDALTIVHDLLVRLRYTRVGYLDFSVANVELLRILARNVMNEKRKHNTLFKENWQDHEFVVYRLTLLKWQEMVNALDELYKRWHHPDDGMNVPTWRLYRVEDLLLERSRHNNSLS